MTEYSDQAKAGAAQEEVAKKCQENAKTQSYRKAQMGKCTDIMREEMTVEQKKTKNWDGNEKANKSKAFFCESQVTTS